MRLITQATLTLDASTAADWHIYIPAPAIAHRARITHKSGKRRPTLRSWATGYPQQRLTGVQLLAFQLGSARLEHLGTISIDSRHPMNLVGNRLTIVHHSSRSIDAAMTTLGATLLSNTWAPPITGTPTTGVSEWRW